MPERSQIGRTETVPVTQVDGDMLPGEVSSGENVRSFGRYVVLERLGAGGMGVVYAAWDRSLDRKVALKLIHPGRIGTERQRKKAIERLVNEARALAKLDYPNVVRVHEVASEGGQVYIAMEFVEGITLRRWLNQATRSWAEVMRVLVPAGRGLEAAHGVDLIHGDFKPDNVIVTNTGGVKVLDFGLARGLGGGPASGDSTSHSSDAKSVSEALMASTESPEDSSPPLERTQGLDESGRTHVTVGGAPGGGDVTRGVTKIAGTPAYMSPEHFEGKSATFLTDQFAFAVVLFEALFGERPFAGSSTAELAVNVMEGALRPELKPRVFVPPFVRRAMFRALSRNPGDRFSNMDALLTQLERRPMRTAMLAGGVLVGIGVAVAVGMGLQTRIDGGQACSAVAEEIQDVPKPSFIAEVRRRVDSTARGRHIKIAEYLGTEVDGYMQRWSAAARRSCDDRFVQKTISQPEYEMRRRCLDFIKERLTLYLGRFDEAPESALLEAGASLRELPDPLSCLEAEKSESSEFQAPSNPEFTTVRRELFEVQNLKLYGSFERAEVQAKRVLTRIDALGNEHLRAQALLMLGNLQSWRGEGKVAYEHFLEGYIAAERSRDDYLRLKYQIALVSELINRDAYERAREGLDRAAAIATRIDSRKLRLEVIQEHRGYLLYREGKYPEATKVLEASFEGARDDRDAWELRRDAGTVLGLIYRNTDQSRKALKYFEEVCHEIEENMGTFHPDIVTCKVNVGSALSSLGRHEDAHAVFDEILEYQAQVIGSMKNMNVAYVYGLKAISFAETLQLEKSAIFQRKSMAVLDELERSESVDGALTLDNLGLTLIFLGELDEAGEVLQRSLKIWSDVAGETHPDISYPQGHLALWHLVQGDLKAARTSHAIAKKLRDAAPQDSTDTSLLDFIGAMLSYRSDPEAARELATAALASVRENPSGVHVPGLKRWLNDPRAPIEGASNLGLILHTAP